ncbi:MAG: sigma-70 family RNA polymerase sigma factor [Lentisphaeria bacterium]|nr:sigma-70 family RNA polymerase sigma factor [Lentisphaeria bacterium]
MSTFKISNKKAFAYTTDSSLLRHVQAGNDIAWDTFYQKYSGMIYSIGQQRQLTAEECDDLMINVMTIFWQKMDDFIYDRNKGKFRSYLGKIANYCAIQLFTRRREMHTVPFEHNADYPAEVDDILMEEWKDYLLSKALEVLRNELDTEIYQVFYMSFIQKCPVEEIAAVTRKTPNNIYVIRTRCLAKLGKLIRKFRQLDEEMLSRHSHKNKSEY